MSFPCRRLASSARQNRTTSAAEAATAAGIAPSYNMLDGFEGQLDEQGHRGSNGWRALGLPWKQS